jgi:photosystem II stability/assembly factor-like uncharacterized protein
VWDGTTPRDPFYSVHGTDAEHVWFAGARSQVLYWDGSQMFQQTEGLPTDKVLRKVMAQSTTRAWIVGDENVFLETRNGGQQWRKSGNDLFLDDWRAVSVIRTDDGLRGWALGHLNGNRMFFDGTSWAPPSPADRNNRTHKYADVEVLGPAKAFAVQDNTTGARIYEWDGSEWSAGPATGTLNDMHVLAPTQGVAVGSRGTVWRLGPDGDWARMPSEPRTSGNDLFAVHMVSDNLIWAVGARGGIWKWNGTDWVSRAIGGNIKDMYSLWLTADGSSGWAVGESGTFLRYE